MNVDNHRLISIIINKRPIWTAPSKTSCNPKFPINYPTAKWGPLHSCTWSSSSAPPTPRVACQCQHSGHYRTPSYTPSHPRDTPSHPHVHPLSPEQSRSLPKPYSSFFLRKIKSFKNEGNFLLGKLLKNNFIINSLLHKIRSS